MNMIEKVAKAIEENVAAALPDGVSVDYDYAAKAALEAMRSHNEQWAMVLENYDASLADEMRNSFNALEEHN